MNVIWLFDSILFWCNQHWIISRRKRRGKENLNKRKRQWNGSDVVSLVFLILRKCTHVWNMKKGECMDKKEVMVEEWKAGRKEWKKKRWKKRKREKVVLAKVLFVFVWLWVFPCTHPPPHHNIRSHLTHHTIQHGALVHTVTCKQGHVLVLLRTHGPFQQNCDDVIFFFAIRGFLLPNSFFYDQPKFFCNLQFEVKSLFCN